MATPSGALAMPEPLGLTPAQLRRKRAFDVALAAVAFVVSAPVCAVAVVAATLDTRQWGVFSQERIGRDGVPFHVHKIRTMRTLAAHTTTVTTVADPRITRLGAVLRRFKIDELPQLVNVLRGEMSLVGPRPLPVYEVEKFYNTAHRRRLSVRPGLTCLWQVSGRNQISFEQWMYLDMQYIDHWSLKGDINLILKTVPVVLTGRGAS